MVSIGAFILVLWLICQVLGVAASVLGTLFKLGLVLLIVGAVLDLTVTRRFWRR